MEPHNSANQTQRYYDKDAGDNHKWNQNENQVYHQYVIDDHKRDREFAKTNSREKHDYSKSSVSKTPDPTL